ncbi:NAD(P)-binding protein [Tothia fuscella]|uniref:NAD(P)-binding protein n=1 Tax=Tothia fuscella TaxID=1048955 RepID=A0A9P4TVS5_9PEZI|nr:NAD(P)-binding protein [Tothia fuscella]
MITIKTVAMIGASGTVGEAVLPALLSTPLKVTAISRSDSTSTFPASVHVIKTSYDLPSLTAALKGEDAVIVALPPSGLAMELMIVDAAVAAGVKWFIPSEYAHDTTDERVIERVPFWKVKLAVVEHLREKEKDGLNWTGLVTGLFFDWAMNLDLIGFNTRERTATLWDEGKVPFSATNVSAIGTAVANLLQNPAALEAAKNKHIFISSVHTTQLEVLAELEKVTGDKFKVENASMKDIVARAQKADPEHLPALVDLVLSVAFHEGGWTDFRGKSEEWNKLLKVDDEPLEVHVRRVVEASKA